MLYFKLKYPSLLSFFLFALGLTSAHSQSVDCSKCHTDNSFRTLEKSFGFSEKAVGVMDKGQLQNNTSNMGDLANFHVWYTNAGHWPRSADLDRQYIYGLGLVVAIDKNNVIETVSQAMTKVVDWLPLDNSPGREYSGDIRAESDDTPFLASSDFRETWPLGYYDENGNWTSSVQREWPGYFRVDVTGISDDTLDMHLDASLLPSRQNEFTSDRDIFCTYNDDANAQGSVGITVEQTAYSYGRPYADDFIFWELRLFNTSGEDLTDVSVGFYSKFRPDFDMHDYINFVDSDGDGQKDLVYVYDLNNEKNKTWAYTDDPLGIVGLRLYDSPGNIGITDFHHFARGVSPTTDEQMWALMTSQKDESALDSIPWYFHGDNRKIDDTSPNALSEYYPSWLDEESGVELEGDGINFIISSGPHDIPADSFVTVTLGLIMGDGGEVPNEADTTDLMNNVRIANNMYQMYFQGSGPPDPPNVEAVAGDGQVTLYWDENPSEYSIDVLSGEKDFEGYKVFRSTDQGKTWGDIVTDGHGIPVGFEPIATFDYTLEEDLERYGINVSGLDPAFPQYLGVNSGLAHTLVDSNLINGLEYWYCVTSYDRGNQVRDSLEQSYLYPIGSSDFESHVVSVIPGAQPTNVVSASISDNTLSAKGGICEGIVRIEIINPAEITGHGYKITFEDSIQVVSTSGDTSIDISFTLIDTTDNDTLFYNHILSDDSGDNLPVVDGLRFTIQNSPTGVSFLGWTYVSGDTSTFDWRTESARPDLVLSEQAEGNEIVTVDDYRITIDTTLYSGVNARWMDIFGGEWSHELTEYETGLPFDSTYYLPLKVEIITDSDNPINISDFTILGEFNMPAPWEYYRRYYYSPLGWDIEPGGLGYNQADEGGSWRELHVDILILSASYGWDNYLFLLTNNTPNTYIDNDGNTINQTAVAPSHGDQFTITTYKPFREGIYYTFGTTASSEPNTSGNTLENIRVVPDPYVVTNVWEKTEFGKYLQFNHLPNQCTIDIYTLMGDFVAKVEHNSNSGYEFWDMRTKNDQFIAPGVYLFHASTPDGNENTGRFLVIK